MKVLPHNMSEEIEEFRWRTAPLPYDRVMVSNVELATVRLIEDVVDVSVEERSSNDEEILEIVVL